MRTAVCTQDNATYIAVDFDRDEDFLTKKRYLVCPRCNEAAYYRGPTKNGREACFGARPHADECDLATVEHDGTPFGQGEEEDEVLTTGQRIVLDLNVGTVATGLATRPAEVPTVNGNGGAYNGLGPAVRDFMTRRMRPLLYSLIASEEFRGSTQIIEVPGQGEFPIADFFVNFAEVTEDHIGSYHGFWGMIPDAQRDGRGTLWFNSGGREDMSALLDQSFIEETYRRFHIEEDEDIAGAYILVLGELRVGPSGKRYVQITDPYCFSLR